MNRENINEPGQNSFYFGWTGTDLRRSGLNKITEFNILNRYFNENSVHSEDFNMKVKHI